MVTRDRASSGSTQVDNWYRGLAWPDVAVVSTGGGSRPGMDSQRVDEMIADRITTRSPGNGGGVVRRYNGEAIAGPRPRSYSGATPRLSVA